MLTRRELIDYCLTYPDSYEDYPFDEDVSAEGAWTVLRHRSNRKSFALVFVRNGILNINLKCEPMEAQFLRGVYPKTVIPAYHMNKEHWNGVLVTPELAEEELFSWIRQSYELTRPGIRKEKSS